jgi:hypothetical protein
MALPAFSAPPHILGFVLSYQPDAPQRQAADFAQMPLAALACECQHTVFVEL